MARQRHQNGYVIPTGKNPVTWTGFFYVYTPDGRRLKRSKVLGPKAKMTKGQAEDTLRKLIRQMEQGVVTPPSQKIFTFKEAADQYTTLKHMDWSKLNERNMNSLFKHHVLPFLGLYAVSDIKPTDIKEWIGNRAATGLSRSIVQKCLCHVRAVFEMLVEDDRLGKNPTRNQSLPKTKKPNAKFLELNEVQALLDAAEDWEYLVLKIMLVCGLRPSEAFGLRLDDLYDGKLRIDEGAVPDQGISDTKTEEAQGFVPIPPSLYVEITQYCAVNKITDAKAFLFPNEMGNMMNHKNFLRRNLARLQKKAGLSGVTHQALRRTVATHLQKHGPVKAAQKLLRHTNANTTMNHYVKDLDGDAVKAVGSWLDEIEGEDNDNE